MQSVTTVHATIEEIEGMFKKVLDQHIPKKDFSNKTYDLEEAGIILKLSPQTLRKRIKAGTIKGQRSGRKFLIPHSEIFDSMEEVKSLKYKRD